MKLNHLAIQSFATGLAVLISISAAVFAWQQVEIGRTHNRLSVVPIIQITPYLEGKNGRNGLYLSNDGLGPAIIKGFSVRSGGVVANGFESDRWAEILATTAANPACFATGWPKGETALRAGVEVPLVYATKAEGAEICLLELVKLVGGNAIEISVDYESIYGEPKHLSANSKAKSKTLDALYQKLITR
jgi:hypothetical protein